MRPHLFYARLRREPTVYCTDRGNALWYGTVQCTVLYSSLYCSVALSVQCTVMHRFTVDRSRHSGLCPGSGYCGEFVIPAQFQEICDSCPIPGDNSWWSHSGSHGGGQRVSNRISQGQGQRFPPQFGHFLLLRFPTSPYARKPKTPTSGCRGDFWRRAYSYIVLK